MKKKNLDNNSNSELLYSTAKNTINQISDIKQLAKYSAAPSPIGVGMLAFDTAIAGIKNFFQSKENLNKELYYKENPLYKPIHDVCKKLAIDSYKNFNIDEPVKNFKRLMDFDDKHTGFFSVAYINASAKELIIAFRGTQVTSVKDIKNDFDMGIKDKLPKQFFIAETFYNDVRTKLEEKINEYKIHFTGHSLGGSIAELMGAKYGFDTVTFNAYGIGNIKDAQINFSDNIINYGNTDDFVFNAKESKHIGINIEISTQIQEKLNCGIRVLKYHSAKNMGMLAVIPQKM